MHSLSKRDQLLSSLLTLVHQVNAACHGILDQESLTGRVVYLIQSATEVQRVAIALVDGEQLCFVASSLGGLEEFTGLLPLQLPLSTTHIYGWVVQHAQTVLVTDPAADARYRYTPQPTDVAVELVVPIRDQQHNVRGVLALQSSNNSDSPRFSQLQPALELIGVNLGITLENQELYLTMLRRTRYAQILDQIRLKADQQLDMTVLLEEIIATLMQHLPFRTVAIYLQEYNHLSLYAHSPNITPPLRRPLLPTEPAPDKSFDMHCIHTLRTPLDSDAALEIELRAGSALLGLLTIEPIIPLNTTEAMLLAEVGAALGQLIERTRLFASMYATNERTTLFARIVSTIRQSLNIHDVIDEVNHVLGVGLQSDWCSLGIIGRNGDLQWHGVYTQPQANAAFPAIATILRHEIMQALEMQRTGIIDDLLYTTQINDPIRTLLLDHGVRALAWSPLQIGERWIGALCIFTIERPHRWALDELRLISDVADQFALAYRQMQLYDAEQQRRRELETLQEIITAISGELNLVALCQNVVHKLLGVFNITAAVVLMWRTPQEPMQPIASVGLSDNAVSQLLMPPAAVNAWIERFPPPSDLYIANISHDPLSRTSPVQHEGLLALYAQPLMVNGVFSGWLQMYQRAPALPFKPDERRLAAAIANQIAQAMHTARRYEEEHMLRTDAEQAYHHLRAVLEELDQTRERLLRSEKLRALGELASGVAHDFNNLLASILGNTQILLQEADPSEHREALHMIEQAAKDGAITVRRIQEFARSSETVYDEVVDLQQVVEVGLEFTRPSWRDQAQQRGITIQIASQLEPAFVLGSAAELREVFVNLLVNAVDAQPNGGRIEVRTFTQGDQAGFSVADHGPGVTPENRTRIFDPFFTTKPLSQGTGLGLAVALSIVQRHRGMLSVESVVPSGARFVATFPRHVQQVAPPRPVVQPQQRSRRIMVVDDDPSVRRVVMRVLEKDQHQVAVAVSAEQALQELQTTAFDIIISDLGMPGMNGWQLLAAARELHPSIRTVLLTGWGYQLDGEQNQHADVIMSKPFELQELRRTIASLIEGADVSA